MSGRALSTVVFVRRPTINAKQGASAKKSDASVVLLVVREVL